MPFINYYKILQVDPSAEDEVIAAAFKRLALKYHPDTNKAADATARMQEINTAYTILSDPKKRASYDLDYSLHIGKEKHQPSQPKKEAKPKAETEPSKPNQSPGQLLYQSNFDVPSIYWSEESDRDYKAFREDGYYCLNVFRLPWERYQYGNISVTNFRVFVDTIFSNPSDHTSECGIVFMANNNDNDHDFYRFAVSKGGYYSLFARFNGQYTELRLLLLQAYKT